ncbi:Uncharacterised protein [Mycobacteroides abscessus subsp. massiliense]|nr:Uncharacterised protein [Mycobacteroides abscessus subsp. abscessus]SKT82013.1 Uncharacterised protein [Mycobacteroides abscessus subsp. massiliense]SKT98299.1 Uncharacterised protein [Mycobacteroides abscessus subsp. massiliense]
MEDKVLERQAVDRGDPSSSVRVTLDPRNSIALGKVLSANDSFLLERTTLESVEGYEVFVELDWTWQRELQAGSAFVWISVPGARFSTHLSRPLGRDLGAVLLGESDVLVPVWMTCDADEPDDPQDSPAGNSDLFPVYFVPTRANMVEVAAPKKAPADKVPVQRRTVPTRAARLAKAHRR